MSWPKPRYLASLDSDGDLFTGFGAPQDLPYVVAEFFLRYRRHGAKVAELLPHQAAVVVSRNGVRRAVIVCDVDGQFGLIEFPADDPDRARRFWSGLLGVELAERGQGEGRGWQTDTGGPTLGIHERGAGPGDTASLPYFTVRDMNAALEQVTALGGSVIHPGAQWAICRDSEGSPFGLALAIPS